MSLLRLLELFRNVEKNQECPCIPGSNWNLKILVFEERGKPEYPPPPQKKNQKNRVENQQQTHPTYDARSGNQTWETLVGGEHSHHFTIPVDPKYM